MGWVFKPFVNSLPHGTSFPILRGPARGIRWVPRSGTAKFWLGTYESSKYKAFAKELSSGAVVYDIGANVGIYTVLACHKVKRVFAFEPSAMNLFHLHRNIEANQFSNCQIVPVAASDRCGTVQFDAVNTCEGRISSNGSQKVQCVSLDSFVADGNPPPSLMKIDVEGAEYDVLVGAKETISRGRPVIFLATHGESVHAKCCKFLCDIGYQLQLLAFDEVVARYPS